MIVCCRSCGASKAFVLGPEIEVVGSQPSVRSSDELIEQKRRARIHPSLPTEAQERMECNASITPGSLRIAASKLLRQGAQEAAGRREMSGALNRLIEQKEKRVIARLMENKGPKPVALI